jgi:cytochrome P450
VWLPKQRVYALPCYAQCKAVLRDDTTFVSGHGVGLNRIFNRLSRGTTLNSDGDEHDQRRKRVAHRLLPRALRTMSDVVTRQAEQLVAEAVRRQHVDGVTDLATAGSRVLVLYASANRDEQEWTDPEVFDIRRNATRHLGFGHGTHACAGQGLARLEMQAMLTALMQQVSRIELAGEPTWAINNIIRCYERLPLRLTSA